MRTVSLVAKPDHILKLAGVSDPARALIELVWNGLDAEAHSIEIELAFNEMDGVSRVVVSDDGHGMNQTECDEYFKLLGGSWKGAVGFSPTLRRLLQGRHGRGRLRAFALGDEVEWSTVGIGVSGGREQTVVRGAARNPVDFQISDPLPASDLPLGTRFESREPARYVNRLTRSDALTRLNAAFALFLLSNPAVSISYRGSRLDPSKAWAAEEKLELPVTMDQDEAPPTLRVIEWPEDVPRSISLCDERGVELAQVPSNIHAPGYSFTAYILWNGFHSYTDTIALADLDAGELGRVLDVARTSLREYFNTRAFSRRQRQVTEWKTQRVYPYGPTEPADAVELAERGLFDEVATTIARRLPKQHDAKRTTLYLLRELVASDPSNVVPLVSEFFKLQKSEQERMRELLEATSLSSIVRATSDVTARFKFLAGLRTMVFDSAQRKVVKERAELHKILEKETWVFGEEFEPMVSDRSLDTVLKRHLKILGRTVETSSMTPVRREGGRRGIVDLVLSRARMSGAVGREHLVVELKAPRVKVGPKEASQIREYAEAVTSDPQFADPRVRWNFWVVSTELSPVVQQEAASPLTPPGCISAWNNNVNIWAKTWAEIIADCETRLNFYRDCLKYDASQQDELQYFRDLHGEVSPPSLLNTGDGPVSQTAPRRKKSSDKKG